MRKDMSGGGGQGKVYRWMEGVYEEEGQVRDEWDLLVRRITL